MILICDLGLSLKKQFTLSEKTRDRVNFIADTSSTIAIGEGANLAKILASFGERHSLLGFVGDYVGEGIHKNLRDNLIDCNFIQIREKSSEEIILEFSGETIKIRDRQPRVTRDEIMDFYSKYKEGLNLYDLICIVGESPLNTPDDMFYKMVNLSAKWGRRILLGVKNKNQQVAIKAVPCVLMLNKSTLEDIINLSLDSENEIIKASRYLFEKGIEHIIIDKDENGLIILNQEYGYRLSVPYEYTRKKISYGGVLGGFALSMNRNYDMETLCKLSYACGLADFENMNINLETTDIKALMKVVEVNRFNNIEGGK